MSSKAIKLQQYLEKNLENLCFIHDQPRLHVTEEFYGLRNTIDIESEELLARMREARLGDYADEVVKVNTTRLEFIRILRELEEKCLSTLPERSTVSSEEVYAGRFRSRIESLKKFSRGQLKAAFDPLALELIEETYQLEKRVLGEQTIFYVSSSKKNQLGDLVFIGEDRLKRYEIEHLQIQLNKASPIKLNSSISNVEVISTLATITKNYIILTSIECFLNSAPDGFRFIYMGLDEEKYTGYSAENATIEKAFVSYRFTSEIRSMIITQVSGIAPRLDLPSLISGGKSTIGVTSSQLRSLDFLSSSSVHRLQHLILQDVVIDSFDGDLISKCVNLRVLHLEFYISSDTFSSLKFLRPLQKLECLALSLQDLNLDLDALTELPVLRNLRLVGASKTKGQHTYPEFNGETVFGRLSVIPSLVRLDLVAFHIDSIDNNSFARFKKLEIVNLLGNRFGRHRRGRIFEQVDRKFGSVAAHFKATCCSRPLELCQMEIQTIEI